MIRRIQRIMTMVRKDVRAGARDQLVTYMLLSPFLLGLLLALVMPAIEQAELEFVVDGSLAPAHVAALDEHGAVEIVADREAVERRVLQRDDVLGVVGGDGTMAYEVLIEGDEPEALRGLPSLILDHGELAGELEPPPAADDRLELRRIATALLGYTVIVVVGLMLGFAILEEKLTDTHRVYDVSPLRFGEYLAGKLGIGLLLALVMVVPAIALPLGWDVAWGSIVVLVLASSPFALALGLIIGVQAKDQLGAIAVMKALLPVWTSLPVLGFVLPEAWIWTQWPFANHWGVQGFYLALGSGEGVGRMAALALLSGLPVLAASAYLLRRRLGFAA